MTAAVRAHGSAASSQLGLHLVDDAAEGSRVVDGHVGQHLAVDVDLGLLQAGHELAVGDAAGRGRGVDAGDPELAEDALAGAAVTVGVLAGLHHRLLGDAEDVLAAAAVSPWPGPGSSCGGRVRLHHV